MKSDRHAHRPTHTHTHTHTQLIFELTCVIFHPHTKPAGWFTANNSTSLGSISCNELERKREGVREQETEGWLQRAGTKQRND